jgi:hypothetical protein
MRRNVCDGITAQPYPTGCPEHCRMFDAGSLPASERRLSKPPETLVAEARLLISELAVSGSTSKSKHLSRPATAPASHACRSLLPRLRSRRRAVWRIASIDTLSAGQARCPPPSKASARRLGPLAAAGLEFVRADRTRAPGPRQRTLRRAPSSQPHRCSALGERLPRSRSLGPAWGSRSCAQAVQDPGRASGTDHHDAQPHPPPAAGRGRARPGPAIHPEDPPEERRPAEAPGPSGRWAGRPLQEVAPCLGVRGRRRPQDPLGAPGSVG